MLPSRLPDRDSFDFHQGVLGQAGHLYGAAGGGLAGEEGSVDLVHGGEVVHILEEYGGLDDILHPPAGLGQDGLDVFQGLAGLAGDAALGERAGGYVDGQLSGGNQQKVILGRWLATNPDFLILDEPTRGIDIGTKTEIQKLVLKLAKEGKSIVFISSEIEEMLRTCTKMAVLRDGAKVGEITESLTQETVMKAIAGGGSNE